MNDIGQIEETDAHTNNGTAELQADLDNAALGDAVERLLTEVRLQCAGMPNELTDHSLRDFLENGEAKDDSSDEQNPMRHAQNRIELRDDAILEAGDSKRVSSSPSVVCGTMAAVWGEKGACCIVTGVSGGRDCIDVCRLSTWSKRLCVDVLRDALESVEMSSLGADSIETLNLDYLPDSLTISKWTISGLHPWIPGHSSNQLSLVQSCHASVSVRGRQA